MKWWLVFIIAGIFMISCTQMLLLTPQAPGMSKKFDLYKTKDGELRVYNIQAGFSHMYLIESKRGLYLIDGGCPYCEKEVLRLMKLLKRKDLKLIIITHGHMDHYGSAAAIRRLTGAKIAIHKDDAEAMARAATPVKHARSWARFAKAILPLGELIMRIERTKPDILLTDNFDLEPFGIKGRIIHTPGHTPGSCTVLIDERIAFVGDLITMTSVPRSQFCFADDWYILAQSIQKIKDLAPQYIYLGHSDRVVLKDEIMNLKPYLPEK